MSESVSTRLRWPDKDPADVLDFSLDWRAELALSGSADSISAVTWTVPAGLTKGIETIADGVAVLWLSGGTAGTTYLITCRIQTAQGRTIERSVRLRVVDR